MDKYYVIEFNNYEGESFEERYRDESNAKARFYELWQEYKDYDEFDGTMFEEFSYFDANYNEYSTYITLSSYPMSELFCD